MDQLVKNAKPTGYQEDEENERPSQDLVKETAERTRLAIERITQSKLAAANPKSVNKPDQAPTFYRYTPGQQGENFNAGAKQRIVRIVDMPVDPMEPPKFRHKKVPNGPPSPPAPVLHSPPRKVTAQEQKEWFIPPCISNWKNSKGYTIPLDKRLAADGRGLQDVQINDKFAILSESLFSAERLVREEIKTRSLYQQKVAEKEKMQKEENLRTLAQQARESRANFGSQSHLPKPQASAQPEDEDAAELQARQDLRREKQKEREREMRLSRMGTEQRAKYLSKQENRDISEKVALGLAKPTISKESMFDSRLFNQSEGINSGFRDEEAYSLYDKALFNGSSANMIYRPKKNMEDDEAEDGDAQLDRIQNANRFGNALGSSRAFQGADKAKDSSGPVQFQKPISSSIDTEIAAFLDEAKKGKRGLDTSRSRNDDDRSGKRERR